MPVVLTFAGSDPTGGAGLQAEILTLTSLGCHPLSVVTTITVQDGSVLWFGLAGIVASVGIVIDNYFHDRSSLSRVIVFPFFMAAVALISYGASTYAIAVSNVPNFPTDAASALSYILYGTIGGLIVAFSGIAIQHLINRYIEPEAPEIIELI